MDVRHRLNCEADGCRTRKKGGEKRNEIYIYTHIPSL